jgi:hypothetical protein
MRADSEVEKLDESRESKLAEKMKAEGRKINAQEGECASGVGDVVNQDSVDAPT